MCGIGGCLNFDKEERIGPGLIENMCKKMIHRGPDDQGVYTKENIGLGCRRLSIIDVSGGHQPMSNEDKTVWIVFNGEIYNYQELKRMLVRAGHRFSTASDTEVIIHLYEELGTESVGKLRGMFSFAIWDENRKELLLSRDRLGIKPLYYNLSSKRLIFSSSINALFQDSGVEREVDFSALDQYLTFRYVPGQETMFRKIKKLPPGCFLMWRDGRVEIRQYWNLKFSNKHKRSLEYYTGSLREGLTEAVRKHLISDVPLGVFLSGGIDSSIIVGLMSKMVHEPVNTFSVGFKIGKSYDELKYAREIAKAYSTNHREIYVEPKIVDLLPKLITFMEEPIADPAAVPLYYLSELASEYVKVVLAGEGADEIFGGYKRYYWAGLANRLKWVPACVKSQFKQMSEKLPFSTSHKKTLRSLLATTDVDSYLSGVAVFNPQEKNLLYSGDLENSILSGKTNRLVKEYFHELSDADLFEKTTYADIKMWLPDDLLTKMDKMSMAHSIEARVPFLDHELVEFSGTIPYHLKYNGTISKYILRHSMSHVLPESIMHRKKHAFDVPIAEWFRKELKDYVYEILLERTSTERGYFDPKRVKNILDTHQKGMQDLSFQIWSLLNLELWHRVYIDDHNP